MKTQKTSNNNTKIITIVSVIALAIIGAMIWSMTLVLNTNGEPAITGAAITQEGFQDVKMAIVGLDYEPSTLSVKAGQKVRWIIDATRAQGCARALYSPELGINTILKSGENVIEFAPPRTGTIKFSCTMGMTSGRFEVA